MIKTLEGTKIPVVLKGHIKGINIYDKKNKNIGKYNVNLVMKFPKSTLSVIYADMRGLKRIAKYEDDKTENKSWFFI